MNGYAQDLDAAFIAFVDDGDFAHIDELACKYGLRRIPHDEVGEASVYKAVQECTHIPANIKERELVKCVALGFNPFIGVDKKGNADD